MISFLQELAMLALALLELGWRGLRGLEADPGYKAWCIHENDSGRELTPEELAYRGER